MRTLGMITLALALCGGTSAWATDLNIECAAEGCTSSSITVGPGCEVMYQIIGELGDADSRGLAAVVLDVAFDGGVLPQADTPTELPMVRFAAPEGFDGPEGFGGIMDAGDLLQVGGMQNVFVHGQWACDGDEECPGGATCSAGVCTAISGLPIGNVLAGVGSPGNPAVLVTGTLTAPAAQGTYTLTVSNITANVLHTTTTGQPFWFSESAGLGTVTGLEITVLDGAVCCGEGSCPDGGFDECADQDLDGVRDNACLWYECSAGVCLATDAKFGDIGGFLGNCVIDGIADGNDHYHALNCFSNRNTTGAPSYPCEAHAGYPATALRADVGGIFGACCPDGVCDINDAFHAMNAFAEINACRCAADGGQSFTCPCPSPSEPPESPVLCPPGPAPQGPGLDSAPTVLGVVDVRLRPSRRQIRPGELVEVDVLLGESVADLRGYQLHLGARAGKRGQLELVDIAIQARKDHVFTGRGAWQAFNVDRAQMLSGLDALGISTRRGGYLATFTYRASSQALGTFVIDLLRDDAAGAYRTFLFATPPSGKLVVGQVSSAVITVGSKRPRLPKRR